MSATAPAMKVWTEQRAGKWDQCTESAYLMVMVYGGYRSFPAGAYTNAERDALTAMSGLVAGDGPGTTFPVLDFGAMERYGLALREVPRGTLRTRLGQAGRAFAIAGWYRDFPADHSLRRWQWGFNAGHAVCVVPLGAGRVLWLDPLADAGYAGDVTTVNTVMSFAWTDTTMFAREATLGELKEADVPLPYFKPAEGDVAPKTPIYEYPGGPQAEVAVGGEAAIMAEHPAGAPDWYQIGVGSRSKDISGADLGVTVPDRLGWVRRNRVTVHNSPADPDFIRAVGGSFYRSLPTAETTGITKAQLDAANRRTEALRSDATNRLERVAEQAQTDASELRAP